MSVKYQGQNALTALLTLLSDKFDTKVDKVTGKGLSTNDLTNELLEKLNGIEAGANKYEHAAHAAQALGLYQVQVDAEGHVIAVKAVEKNDITALGIPGQDTTYVVATDEADGLMSAADKEKLDGVEEGANNYVHAEHTEHANGFYKITVDAEGHVSAVEAVAKSDLSALIGEATTTESGLMSAADKTKIEGIAAGAQVNVIEKVLVNGEEQTVTDKGVSISVPTGSLANKNEVTESDLSAELKEKVNAASEGNHSHNNKELLDTYTQTEENLADAVAKKHSHANSAELNLIESGDKAKWDKAVSDLSEEITRAKAAEEANAAAITSGDSSTLQSAKEYANEQITARITSVYKASGSVTLSELPEPSADTLGNVYNVSEEFVPAADVFVDGGGSKTFPAGTNIVVVQSGGTYKYDILAGFVDLSDYLKSENAENTYLKKADAESTYVTKTAAEAFAKTADFEEMTAEEVQTAWNAVFTA